MEKQKDENNSNSSENVSAKISSSEEHDEKSKNIQNKEKLREVFIKEKPEAIIHFAGYKAVGESVAKPLMYYQNNLESTFALLDCMAEFNVKNLVFSSSATVYGLPDKVPLTEDSPVKSATSP